MPDLVDDLRRRIADAGDLVDAIATRHVGEILRGHPDQVAPVIRDFFTRREALKHLR